MSGQRQPVELVIANGKKNLTKAEIKARLESEVKPVTDNITAPAYLTKKQKEEFYRYSGQLQKLKIMGETDVDALGRFITAKDMYENAVKQMRKPEVKNNPYVFEKWIKIQDKLFKQCRASANDLGLSISSRCKLVVPEANKEVKKENKFARFEKRAGNE